MASEPMSLAQHLGLRHLLHEPGLVPLGRGVNLYVLYPLIRWIGVMAAGYLLGPVMQLEGRRGSAFWSGSALL